MARISGELSLRTAQHLVEMLKQALAKYSNITVVFDAVTSIDITTLQILLAARNSAMAAGTLLTLQLPAEGMVPELLRRAGFIDADGTAMTPEGDFWAPPPTKGAAA